MNILMGISYLKTPFWFNNDITRFGNAVHQQSLNVYLHRPGTLPDSQPTYILKLGSHSTLTIDFDVVESNHISRPGLQCKNPVVVKHAKYEMKLPVDACDKYHRRKLIRETCKCEAWWSPLENFDHVKNNSLCGFMRSKPIEAVAQELDCLRRVSESDLHRANHCGKPCHAITYSPRIYANRMPEAYTNTMIRNFLIELEMDYLRRNCSSTGGNTSENCRITENNIYKSYTNGSSEEIKRMVLKRLSAFTIEPEHDAKPFPEDQHSPPWNSTKDELQFIIQMVVRSNYPIVFVQTERFVHTPLTVTVQFVGACSFLAGITFGVIGEFVDIVYRAFRMHSTRSGPAPQELPAINNRI